MVRYSLPVISDLRARKNPSEIRSIIKAQHIAEIVLAYVLEKLRVGVTEEFIASCIVSKFKSKGVKALAFEPIVSFGPNSANIHHHPGKRKLREGDTIMIDIGATSDGYCSDMSRTFFYGLPNKKQMQVYLGVLEAQEEVLDAIEEGERSAKKLDRIARSFLSRRFGKQAFPHGLGHGIGMAIHEWPSIRPKSDDVLQDGMVVTIEPGVYIKGWGGVRIEDMVLITKDGHRVLSSQPKHLNSVILTVKKQLRRKRAR